MKALAAMLLAGVVLASACLASDNQLTPREKRDGWLLLFDGKTLNGWLTSTRTPSKTPPTGRTGRAATF